MTTTVIRRPVIGLLGETAAGTATAAAYLAVSAIHAGAYRPGRAHR
jgi:hypothetical protein